MPIKSLRKIQIGIESDLAHGTPVAASKRLIGGTLRMTPAPEFYMPAEEERGTMAKFKRRETIRDGTKLTYEGPASFQQIINFLSCCVLGVDTPTTPDGGTNSRDWTYTPSLTVNTDNVLQSFTLEYGDDQQEYECPYVVGTSLELTMAMNEPWTMKAELIAWPESKSTFTSVAEHTTELILGPKSTIAIDTTWAGLGGTAKASLLASATIRFPNFFAPVKYADGNNYFSSMVVQPLAAEIEVLFRHDADGEAAYDAFRADGGTQQFIRIKTLGSVIETTLYNTLTIDMAVKWTEPPEFFTDLNGENYIRLKGVTFPDASANWLSVVVRNAITALPG